MIKAFYEIAALFRMSKSDMDWGILSVVVLVVCVLIIVALLAMLYNKISERRLEKTDAINQSGE